MASWEADFRVLPVPVCVWELPAGWLWGRAWGSSMLPRGSFSGQCLGRGALSCPGVVWSELLGGVLTLGERGGRGLWVRKGPEGRGGWPGKAVATLCPVQTLIHWEGRDARHCLPLSFSQRTKFPGSWGPSVTGKTLFAPGLLSDQQFPSWSSPRLERWPGAVGRWRCTQPGPGRRLGMQSVLVTPVTVNRDSSQEH